MDGIFQFYFIICLCSMCHTFLCIPLHVLTFSPHFSFFIGKVSFFNAKMRFLTCKEACALTPTTALYVVNCNDVVHKNYQNTDNISSRFPRKFEVNDLKKYIVTSYSQLISFRVFFVSGVFLVHHMKFTSCNKKMMIFELLQRKASCKYLLLLLLHLTDVDFKLL